MRTIKVYPNRSTPLAERIGRAIEHYLVHNPGKLPALAIVNAQDEQKAIQAVKVLDLDLSVIVEVGPLPGEVWLVVPNDTSET